ncbi:hypothetical protein [Burkholderia thailandensis]|uniref:hypothetical protein n=1 Tax=Burkholderia thailandensis TaxID=57975 RepID=UPI001EE2E995|nr:hypothetical protein [Burkholderia thailandensis]
MTAESASSATAAAPSLDDVLAFVREHAGDARLPSGELLADHATGTSTIMQRLNVDPPATQAAALSLSRRI